ncbi:hypothetical protein [Arcanobacterium hippocoleae]|uniref:hypothetical protein n=1 Tax=Arcanobacterium hippocoleae TaxID=149017 RepID=UPI0036711D13
MKALKETLRVMPQDAFSTTITFEYRDERPENMLPLLPPAEDQVERCLAGFGKEFCGRKLSKVSDFIFQIVK